MYPLVVAPVLAGQVKNLHWPEPAHQPVIIDVDLEARTNQSRGHGVKYATHRDRASSCHHHADQREISRPKLGQWSHRFELQANFGTPASIATPDQLRHKGLVMS